VVDGIGPALGRGPIYPVLGSDGVVGLSETASVEASLYWKTLWIAAPAYEGPVLVRGRRLDGDAPLRFGANGQYDLEELQLPVRAWATSDGVDPSWRQWPSYTGAEGAGCYGYQIDGLDFTRQVVFELVAGQ